MTWSSWKSAKKISVLKSLNEIGIAAKVLQLFVRNWKFKLEHHGVKRYLIISFIDITWQSRARLKRRHPRKCFGMYQLINRRFNQQTKSVMWSFHIRMETIYQFILQHSRFINLREMCFVLMQCEKRRKIWPTLLNLREFLSRFSKVVFGNGNAFLEFNSTALILAKDI